MFLNTKNLNEGVSLRYNLNIKKEVMQEGKNPKTTDLLSNENNWQVSNKSLYGNSRWEKLRK